MKRPPIPANLRAAVDDLREYINPPRDVARARTLRKRGDAATAAESDELVALADHHVHLDPATEKVAR